MRVIDTSTITRSTYLSPDDAEWVYNGLDCAVTLEVLEALLPQLDNVSAQTYAFSRNLQGPILDMTTRGIRVDQKKRSEGIQRIYGKIERIQEQLTRIIKEGIGVDLNWRSPQQLASLFYDVLNLPPVRKRNANGQMVPTTNRDALERLSHYLIAEPITAHLIALRELDKKRQLLETGIDPDGRIRTNFNIAGTNTGRLASAVSDFGTGTNLQNIDREERAIFVADPGMKFGNLDLEQGDARNVGAIIWNLFSERYGDSAGSYLDACESGDLHTTVCRMAWKNLEWTDDPKANKKVAEAIAYRQDSYRQLAKKLGHGTNYYGLPPTMARHTKVEIPVIDTFQRNYFDAFPLIGSHDKRDRKADHWHNHVRNQLFDTHSITSLMGRRRYFYGRPGDDETLRGAIAYEPQSLTADEIDTALLRLWLGNRVQLLIQVHDSILFQYPEEQEEEVLAWALEVMKVHIPLAKGRDFYVPVEAKVGWNWGDESDKNPDGLVKWKGQDKRKRSEKVVDRLSIFSLAGNSRRG